MEASADTALYPLHRCKTVYLVRHAQGIHNVEGDKDPSAYNSLALLDAHLTPLGWKQAECLREHVNKSGLAKRIELVISSPLLRAMQTAVGVFGGENNTHGVSAPPLMVENTVHSGHPAVSSLNCPPFLAVETCREQLGVYPCDKRRTITEYRTLFPAIDFSLIENDEDALWEPDVREANDSVAARGVKFIDWLWTREEKEIAIVSHCGFLFRTLSMYSKECHPTIQEELSKLGCLAQLRFTLQQLLLEELCQTVENETAPLVEQKKRFFHFVLEWRSRKSCSHLLLHHFILSQSAPALFAKRFYKLLLLHQKSCSIRRVRARAGGARAGALRPIYKNLLHLVACSFENCELRSIMLVDRSVLGSDSSSWNYSGMIPAE